MTAPKLPDGSGDGDGDDGPRSVPLLDKLRATMLLAGFFALTLPLMPVQAALLAIWPGAARRFPHWYHRQVCRLLGIRVSVEGAVAPDRPVLLVANHTSWLDIVVISAVAPLSFVAKKEVGEWPFVSWLARLQRTVFVDRRRRTATGTTASEMAERLAAGDTLVLFAEGTSSDGNRVLPFKTSLLAAAKPSRATGAVRQPSTAVVQTLAIVYTHLHGVPLTRADRPLIGWYGDMDLGPHAWALLQAGPLDVSLRLSEPLPLDDFIDRKVLARQSEQSVRAAVTCLLRRPQRESTDT